MYNQISRTQKYSYNYTVILKNGTTYELENYSKSFYQTLSSSDNFEVNHFNMTIRQK